ncbi:MAG TPA: diacylglycerol kinase family protein [Gaiellaceae bacterium]|nr:diacylglycerol kinase family protein [Gaiellaceae bacterium]
MLDVATSERAAGQPLRAVRPTTRRMAGAGSNLLLVANPNASGLHDSRETVDRAASLLRSFGAFVETRWTGSAGELEEFVSEEERRIVLIGGDGTLHAVANICGHKPEVALLPRGRANNMARALGVPLGLKSAARLAVQGIAHPIDGIAVEAHGLTMTALEGVSVGFHAQARALYRGVNSADTAAGVAAAVRAFTHFEPVLLALEIDGESEVRRVDQLFVANFPLFGPRLAVAPGADPGDGVLEVVELDAGNRARLARDLVLLKRGTHVGHGGVQIRPARQIRLAPDGGSPVVADTTVLGPGPVALGVRPQAVHVVGPGR